MGGRKRGVNTSLLDGVTADMLGGGDFEILDDGGTRVERILLEMVRPDPVQPRRVLPERVYHAFHSNRLTPTQALRELIQTAQIAARQNGRPFNNVTELLGEPEDEVHESTALTPEEFLVRDLVNLAMTIRDDGQVNPLTIVDVTQGVTRLYRIETGERRYWATWLLRDFIPGYESDGLIPCIVVSPEKASPFRQAKENSARAGLSAIAMARQAALLLLAVHGYSFPDGAVDNNFYRQALELDLRGHREYSAAILSAMGGISRMHFSRYKALLHLSDEALELADRHNLDEFRLRFVLELSLEEQAEMVQQIIQLNLTGRQIKQICEGDSGDEQEHLNQRERQVRRFVRLVRAIDMRSPQELAQMLVTEEKSKEMAIARLRSLSSYLEEVEGLLKAN